MLGILVYIGLVFSIPFLGMPFYSLLAIPIFLTTFIMGLFCVVYFPCKDPERVRSLAVILGVCGYIVLVYTMIGGASLYDSEPLNKYGGFSSFQINSKLEIIYLFTVTSSTILVIGIKLWTHAQRMYLFLMWLFAIASVPLTMLWMRILVVLGFPLST
jgi:hypothetical protein